MHIYGKSIAEIQGSDDEKFGPNGGFTAVLSTPSLDRDGDRLQRDEWIEPLPDRLPLDVDHGMSVSDTIGSFHPYFDGDVMMMDAYFASTEKAQTVRTLVQEGHIRSVSVAFMSDKSQKEAGGAFREILNAGVVNTPANRDAVILASKAASALKDALSDVPEGDALDAVRKAVTEALGPDKPAEKKSTIYVDVVPRINPEAFKKAIEDVVTKAAGGGDAALVQAIHDASSHLGAICIQLETDEDPSGADDGANKSVSKAEAKEALTLEQFEAALDQPTEPSEESPAEAAAASDEEPAPADEAADEPIDEVDPDKRARDMALLLSAYQN